MAVVTSATLSATMRLVAGFDGLGCGVDHAVGNVVFDQAEADLVQGGVDRRDLREDVDAVFFLVNHAGDPAHLALDATQSLQQGLLVGGVGVVYMFINGGCNVFHTLNNTPKGYVVKYPPGVCEW